MTLEERMQIWQAHAANCRNPQTSVSVPTDDEGCSTPQPHTVVEILSRHGDASADDQKEGC